MPSPTLNLPPVALAGAYDVIVCGGGPAGLGAALAAGRAGARTLLLERLGAIGGLAVHSPINTWCDTPGGRLFNELEARLAALGKVRRAFSPDRHVYPRGRAVLEGEALKLIAMEMLREAGVEVRLGTAFVQALTEDERVTGVVAADKNGLYALSSQVVIDCTADADVAASAGAECLKGDPADGRLMHVNFMFQILGADREQYEARKPATDDLLALFAAARERGELTVPPGCFRPQADTFPYVPGEDCLALNSWEIEGVDCSDWAAVNELLGQCQVAALQVVRFARAHLPGYEDCAVGRVWDVLGTRESRRLVGRATLTGEDVLAARKFPDGIAQATFFIDFHDSPPGRSIPYTQDFRVSHAPPLGDWYEIPYGCLVPERVTGLLVAGRCLSAAREGLASMRVMPSCMFTGEAAGTAAALAVQRGLLPHELDGRELKPLLMTPDQLM